MTFPSKVDSLKSSQIKFTMCLQVISVYIGVDIRDYYLNIGFFIAYVWCCATFAVVFYGVDSVDRDGDVDLKNEENYHWIHVSQTFFKQPTS